MTPPPHFPAPLLNAPWPARLKHFQDFTVAHPRLVDAKDRLLAAIRECAPNSVILVLGPTGVGKTTLRMRVEQILSAESLAALQADPASLPVVSIEAVAPPSGSFNWRDHFRRMLYEMNEPLIDQKRKMESCDGDVRFMPGIKAHGEQYHYAVEQALRYRRPRAVLVDEAQHLAKMASGRRLLDQLDVIKSIANRTGTVHVLFGTYDLLAFRNLSGQLSRRSVDVHFCRYRAGDAEDRRTFLNVLGSFERQMPLPEPPELVANWEFLYERSIGCVGVLKEWLVRALAAALSRGASKLTHRDLSAQALTISQCEKMLAEVTEGEARLTESDGARSRFRLALGLPGIEVDQGRMSAPAPAQQRRMPGQRYAKRDPIGKPVFAHATTGTI
jgi:energy-coupling factor transporter ATP-binding protein EcfA2